MPFEISWHEEGRVMYAHGTGLITLDDVVAINEVVWENSRQTGDPVHSIINSMDVEEMPIDVQALISAIDLFNEPGLGWFVHVTQSPFMSFVLQVAAHVTNTPYWTVKTVDEAFDFLEQHWLLTQSWQQDGVG